jgi:hypothetical protein
VTDTTHLSALRVRLSHERQRLGSATKETERALRRQWIAQIEREIEGEKAFLGITETEAAPDLELTDDELLTELLGTENRDGRSGIWL